MPSVCLVTSLVGEHFPAELIEERSDAAIQGRQHGPGGPGLPRRKGGSQ